MKILSKILLSLFISAFFNPVLLLSQSFEKNILIDIPGDNYDFDLVAIDNYPGAESFITWINKNDSIYTVFLKKISPEISDTNIIISSNSDIKSNPKVAINRYAQGIKIVWQNYSNNYFQIIGCNYLNDSLSNKTVIIDSLNNDPLISLSTHRIAWINDKKLFIKEFYPTIGNPILVDSLNCSSPNIIKEDAITSTQILYEKIENEIHKIFLAEFNEYSNPKWTLNIVSDGNNRNPNFGIEGGVSFETIENNISKIKYSPYGTMKFDSTSNISCNYKNPNVFSYLVPTRSTNHKTPFFVAFDTDSLENDNEIFIKTFYYELYDSLINISNMEGNDYKPKVAYLVNEDTVYVAIIWLHQNNSKTDIWIAKEVFNPIYSLVNDESISINSFNLDQNYPNPFNPTTTIGFVIPNEVRNLKDTHSREYYSVLQHVTLKVYDVLGREVATLVNEQKPEGSYEVKFDASDLSSGIYFYRLTAGSFVQMRKMILMK